jgi:BA14K-like protein
MEYDMRSKIFAGTAALALAACTITLSAAPAAAAPWGWHRGFGWGGAVATGVIGGVLAAATAPLWAPGYYDYDPGYAYPPVPAPAYTYNYVAPGADAGWCEAHYRSYNPATGMFLGYDGQYHPCP